MRAYILYRLVDEWNNPFYIGVTNNISRRYIEHLSDFKKNKSKKFNNITSFTLDVILINTNKKFNIKLIETYIIVYDKLFGDKILKNQYIY